MKKEARVIGSVIGSETECENFIETQLEKHNKLLKKNLTRLQKNIAAKRVLMLRQRVQKKNYRLKLKLTSIPQKICRPARRYCRKISFHVYLVNIIFAISSETSLLYQ